MMFTWIGLASMFISEFKRIYQNTLIRWAIPCLLIGFILFASNIFYGIENQNYKEEFSRRDPIESIQNSYLSSQVEAYSNYKKDIIGKIDSNETKLKMSVFDNAIIRAQLEAENKTLRQIQTMNVQIVPGYAMTGIFESSFFSIIILVLCSLLLYSIFFEDMISHTLTLYKSTSRSLSMLFFVKLAVFIFTTLLFTILCMITVFFMAKWDGLDLQTPIQWLMDYRFDRYLLTVFDQIVLMMLTQAGAAIFIGLLILMLVIILRNLSLGYGVALLALLIEFFLYSFASITSSFTAIKYINIYYYLFGSINHPQWILFANIMLDFRRVSMIVALMVGIIVLVISKRYYIQLSTEFSHQKNSGYRVYSTNLGWHEFLRTFFFSKGFVLILLVLVYSLNRYIDFSVSKSQGQLEYEMIESRYYGHLNKTALDKITLDIEEARLALERLESFNSDDQVQLSKDEYQALDTIARPYPSLIRIKEKMSQLYGAGAQYFIEDTGYDFIFEDKSNFTVIIHFLLITITLSLFVAMNVHSEYQKKLSQLYHSTKNGHVKKQHIDLLLYSGVVFLLTIIVYGLFLLKIQKGYSVYDQNMPLVAITSATTSSMNLLNYTLLSLILHLFVYSSMVHMVFNLSRKYDLAVVVVIMLGFAFVQVALFSFIPALSILHLLTISLVNNLWVSLLWVGVLVVLDILIFLRINQSNV